MPEGRSGVGAQELPLAVVGNREATRSLGRQVRRGAGWSAASTTIARLTNIAIMIVVARLVSPDELGVFALAITVQAFLVTFAELGVASAITRSDLDVDRIAPTVTAISCACSALLAVLMAGLAGPIAIALGNPAATGPIRILSITVFLIGPFAVPGALLQRDFRQDILFRAHLIGFAPGSIVLLALASVGDGATAFAWSRVVGQLVAGTVMVASLSKIYPPRIDRSVLRPLINFGVPLAGANLLSQVLLNVDYVLLGRTSSPAEVGVYMLAFGVAGWPTAVIGSMLASVTLPMFSTVRRDGGDVAKLLRDSVRMVSLVAFPIAGFIAVFASPIISVLYGKQWGAAADPLRVLSVYGAIFVICLLFANIVVAVGRTKALFVVQAVALVFLVPSLYAGITLGGLVGVGIAHAVVIVVITLPVYLNIVRRTTGVAVVTSLVAMIRPALAAAVAGAAGLAATVEIQPAVAKLIVGGMVGLVVYLMLVATALIPLIPPRLMRSRPFTLIPSRFSPLTAGGPPEEAAGQPEDRHRGQDGRQ